MSSACLVGFPGLRQLLSSFRPAFASSNGFSRLSHRGSTVGRPLSYSLAFPRAQGPANGELRAISSQKRSFHPAAPAFARPRPKKPSPLRRTSTPPQRHSPPRPQSIPELSAEDTNKSFGIPIDTAVGNSILRLLHHRRQIGALIDKGFQLPADYVPVPERNLQSALDWLRAKYPLDEENAAQAWAEKESKKLEHAYIRRGEELGLYKKDDGPIEGSGRQGRRPSKKTVLQVEDDGVVRTGKVYGSDPRESVLENLKKVGDRRRAAELAREKADAQAHEKSGGLQTSVQQGKVAVGSAAQLRQIKQAHFEQVQAEKLKRNEEWVDYFRKKAEGSTSNEVPNHTTAQRLGPSILFSGAVLSAIFFVAYYYNPPKQDQRLFPDIPTAYATLGGITALNLLVYVMWRYPPAWAMLNKYFVCVPAKPVPFSMIGNLFSHQDIKHLSGNMFALWAFGIELHEYVGRGNFIAIYLSGGLLGAFVSFSSSVLRRVWTYWHFGASGCSYAVMTGWVFIHATMPLNRDSVYSYSADIGRYAFAFFAMLQHFSRRYMAEHDTIAHAVGALTGYIWVQVLKFRAKVNLKEGQSGPVWQRKPET